MRMVGWSSSLMVAFLVSGVVSHVARTDRCLRLSFEHSQHK